jgi:hypothetical protein
MTKGPRLALLPATVVSSRWKLKKPLLEPKDEALIFYRM